jgi:hypothetical protein
MYDVFWKNMIMIDIQLDNAYKQGTHIVLECISW